MLNILRFSFLQLYLCYVIFLCSAFVAPADIQAFTSEAKNKLSARLQGKTKYFAQAVKEICAAFDEMQKQKASGLTDDTDDSRIGSEAPSNDGVVVNLKDAIDTVLSNAEQDNIDMENIDSNLEHCTPRVGENDSQDEKHSVSDHPNESSSVSSPVIKSKLSMGSEPKKNANKSSLKVASNVNDFGQDDNRHSGLANGTKPRKLVNGLRKRSEAASDRDRNGGSSTGIFKEENCTGRGDLSRSRETMKAGKKRKNAFDVKLDSPDTLKSDNNDNTGEKDSNMIKVKTSLEVKNELPEFSVDSKDGDGKSSSMRKKMQLHATYTLGANESLHATKKLKRTDTKDDSTLGYPSKVLKKTSPGSTVIEERPFKKSELKKSTPNLKTEKSLSSRGKISGAVSDDSVHELLSATRHHIQVQKVTPDSSVIASEEKKERNYLRLKGDTSNVMVKQVERKRRAVCLFDDDDDEPKTPVHGAAGKNVKSSSVSDAKRSNNAHSEKSDVPLAQGSSSEREDSHLKEPSSQLYNESLSIKQPLKEKDREKDDEVIPVHIPHSPENLDLKQLPSNAAKLSSISPLKSPQLVPANKSSAERNKASKLSLKVSGNATQKRVDHAPSKYSHNLSSSQNQVATHKKKPASLAEISKTTPETLPQAVEVPVSTIGFKDTDALHVDR